MFFRKKFPKQMKAINAALLWNPNLAVAYKWKLCKDVKCGTKKKEAEKRILPPSVGASHFTSKEAFSLGRHPINHRVIFHHQLLVPSTLVFSTLTWRGGGRGAGGACGLLQAVTPVLLLLLLFYRHSLTPAGHGRSCRP